VRASGEVAGLEPHTYTANEGTEMANLHCRSIERRRTTRAVVTIEVEVVGLDERKQKFRFLSRTVSVSEHGGVILLEAPLAVGQGFQMVNEFNRKKAACRIVSVRIGKDSRLHGAFELVCGETNFWSMTFPASGAKPLRKIGVAAKKNLER
jgi:hypothetical protein